MKRILGCAVLCLLLLSGTALQAAEPLVLYDNFKANLINPSKWFGVEKFDAPFFRENLRRVEQHSTLGNQLRLMSRAYAGMGSDSGDEKGGNRLVFTRPDGIKAMKATFWVNGYTSKGCAGNSVPANARARLSGFFFNTGTPTQWSSQHDVMAQIFIQRKSDSKDAPDTLRVVGTIVECQDDNCYTFTPLDTRQLGTIKVGSKVTLYIEWDKANKRFIFQRDTKPQVFSTYTVSDSSAPGTVFNKRIDVQLNVPNCTSSPRPTAHMDVYVDDVYVNQSALSAPVSLALEEDAPRADVCMGDGNGP